jgi:transcriptional regulator with XRE-family HTH domain
MPQGSKEKRKKMKRPEEIDTLPLFDDILVETSDEAKLFVQRSLAIANQIAQLLEKKGMKQKDLADLLGKKEAEVSRWLSGFHNYTIKSIAKIEKVLETQIVYTPAELETNDLFGEEAIATHPLCTKGYYKEIFNTLLQARTYQIREESRPLITPPEQRAHEEIDYTTSKSTLKIVA